MKTLSSFAQRGFTLIELLVATSLLILLSTVVIASFRQANISSRDAKRKADVQLIRGSIEAYRLENGTYPGTEGSEVTSSGGTMMSTLGLENFTSGQINDPLNEAPYFYSYTFHNVPGCPYELGAVMEKSGNAQACNSACGGGNPEDYYCVSN